MGAARAAKRAKVAARPPKTKLQGWTPWGAFGARERAGARGSWVAALTPFRPQLFSQGERTMTIPHPNGQKERTGFESSAPFDVRRALCLRGSDRGCC